MTSWVVHWRWRFRMDKAVLGFQGRKLSTPLNAAAEEKPLSHDLMTLYILMLYQAMLPKFEPNE